MIKVIPQYVPKEPFTVLVSGGLDSIAAAHWLKHNYHKKFFILHFNHRVQATNDDMRNAVRQFCIDFSIPYDSYFRTDGEFPDTSENGLREFRLSVMKMIGGKFVTAHHLNDACENYLDNCFKGCPEHKPINEFTQFNGFSIYHPFLKTTKQDFMDYAKEHGLGKYIVNDDSNSDTKYKRNWIRHKIIPEINDRNLGLETVVLKKFYNNTKIIG
jgi:tRNA(Ile)-lysidine synthase